MKVVITGGAGFIGSHLVDAYIERGADVQVVDTFVAGQREDRINPKATYHEIDIRDYDALAPVIKGAEYLFHEAALPSVQYSIDHPVETFSVNAQGMVNVLKAAQEGGVKRVLFASTGAVYGDQEKMPLTEDMLPRPKSPYGLHKYLGELLCRQWSEIYGLPTVCLRFPNIYGPRFNLRGAYTTAIGKFILQKAKGESLTIFGDGTHTRDYVHVSDIIRAKILAMESEKVGRGEVINIGTGKNISINELAILIGGPVIHGKERLESAHVQMDFTLAKKLLGYEPRIALEDGIAELKKLNEP